MESRLIEGGNPVEQQVELVLHSGDRFVSDQFVEHHRQARVAPGHSVERLESRPHVIDGIEDVPALVPLEIQPDDFNRFFEAQTFQYLNVEEIVERLPDIGNAVEVQRCGGQQQAAVVGH